MIYPAIARLLHACKTKAIKAELEVAGDDRPIAACTTNVKFTAYITSTLASYIS